MLNDPAMKGEIELGIMQRIGNIAALHVVGSG
jgi:hypothetical protein